jgi:hypothetical protein
MLKCFFFVFNVRISTSPTKIPKQDTQVEQEEEKGGRSREEETAIIIFVKSFHLHGSAGTKRTHLSVLPNSSFSSFIYPDLSSLCVTSFPTCCSHPDLGIPVGHFYFTCMFKTFFGMQSSLTLPLVYQFIFHNLYI